jgi:hypothetical protein
VISLCPCDLVAGKKVATKALRQKVSLNGV